MEKFCTKKVKNKIYIEKSARLKAEMIVFYMKIE